MARARFGPRTTGASIVIVLGVDTGGSACSVALWRDGAVLAEESRSMTRGHAEMLVPMIAGAAARAGVALADVGLYGVTVGPGAFTGLRIGLAAVAGLALAARSAERRGGEGGGRRGRCRG